MAGVALKFGVRIGESEIGLGVIKAPVVKVRNPGGSPLVIGMTRAAVLALHGRRPAVVTGLVQDVRGNRLVAIQAKAVLLRLPEWCVALLALHFEFAVRLGQLSRHHQ